MSTKALFTCGGRVKLNFRERYRKLNIFSKNSNHYQLFSSNSQKLSLWCKKIIIKFFHQILKNCHFGVKKNQYPPRWICMTHIWSPTLFPRGIMIFQGVLNKFPFFIKISISGKNCKFEERP